VQALADFSAGGKSPYPPAPGICKGEGPRLSLVTALPPSLLQEHLRPWLRTLEVAGLRVACKALRALVKEWPMHPVAELQAALICFPSIIDDGMTIRADREATCSRGRGVVESRVVELLRGHGGTIGAAPLICRASGGAAQPHLFQARLAVKDPIHRQILSGGKLRLLKDVRVTIRQSNRKQLQALEHLRHLPDLRRLSLTCGRALATFPPFIPPSLKALTLLIMPIGPLQSPLRELPSMLQASGASLVEFKFVCKEELLAECGAALAQVLRTCSSTLKTLELAGSSGERRDYSYISDLVPGLMSCCDTLEILKCPWAVFSALLATCPTFPRLTNLSLKGRAGAAIDLTSPVWNIMASGRFPALDVLDITFSHGILWRQGEGGDRLARAFEAVAGTLQLLSLKYGFDHIRGTESVPAEACYEVGVAIGKLRRLRYLSLDLLPDGRDYRAVGRGVAASGGCPELFELSVGGLESNLDWFITDSSLILPSVRNLYINGRGTVEEILLLCCLWVLAGYQHLLCIRMSDADEHALPPAVSECMRAILSYHGMNALVR
jgi:hypothetical protein